jgi:monooxygenase
VTAEHVDVLIVGAGLSGVGAACHLARDCPGKTYAVLEARDAIGGTWDLFRYPGVRSDSDMFTLGYSFRPWPGDKTLADGASILAYVRETAREHGVESHVRYGHRAVAADWADGRWTVRIAGKPDLTCDFLFTCTGYYAYDEPYAPEFPGQADFAGPLVHPQQWPADLDHTGKRVVVIGSGATAVTVVPAMAETAAHVTMLQRTPSWIMPLPSRDTLAAALRRRLPERIAAPLVRWKNVALITANYQLSRRRPELVKRLLHGLRRKQLPDRALDADFTPPYDPWDQRMCFVPDGDLFAAVRSGRAEVVTGTIDRFTPGGVRLASGRELPADIVVSATGLTLLALGGMTLSVDGRPVDLATTVAYKGMMLSGVPNFAIALGYTNASWTLKCDLVSRYVCRLLTHMDRTGARMVVPGRPSGPYSPIIDLSAGYVRRGVDRLPRQGPRPPWRLHQNYFRDVRMLGHGPLTDGVTFR